MAVNSIEPGQISARVKFDEVDSVSAGSPPCSSICKTIFRHIQQLGETNIEEYHGYIGADQLRKPWRDQMRRRAKFIARSAKQLDDPTQLSILQSEIMARLSVEVECKKCRARFWHTERSTLPERLSNEHAAALKDQQANRAPCICDAGSGNKEDDERGTRLLFFEETDEEPADENEPHSQPSNARKTAHQIYNIRIPNEGSLENNFSYRKWVFPFLVVASSEPEGEESDTSSRKIPHETVVKTMQLLVSQEGLRQDAGETTEWEAGPLAWAVSHRGNHWSISAFYMEGNDTDECCVHILPLWNGCVRSPSHALQLLLIVDYIVDWAREIYRGAIINSLTKALENGPKPMVMVHQTRTSRRFCQVSHGSSGATKHPKTSTGDPLRKYDSQYGVIRDARYVRSLFVALYVTEDNFETLMGSISADERKSLANSILRCLTEAWRISREGLDAIERMWTNKSREGADHYPKDKVFLTVMTVTAYLTPSWEPTRELGYLAVAESLFDRLLEMACLHRHPGRAPAGFPTVDRAVATFFSVLKQCTAQDTLKACVARVCRHSGIEAMVCGDPEGEKSSNWQIFVSEMTAEGMRHRLDVVIKPASISKARNIVFDLFTGQMVQVSSSLFRISSLLEELPRPGEPKEYPEPPVGDESLWGSPPGLPDFEEKNVVLATTAEPRKAGGGRDELCVFVMDPTVLETGLPLTTLLETHPDWHLRVKRFHRKHGWGARDGNLGNFICRDHSMEPKLAEYRKHLEGATEQGQLPGDASSTGSEGFWAAKEYTSSITTISAAGYKADFMSALSLAEAMRPGHRLNSIVWRNPPKNAETVVKWRITVDSNGNPVRPSDSGPSTTSSQRRTSNNIANGSQPAIVVTDTSLVDEAEGGLKSLQAVPDSKRVIELDPNSEEPEAGPSKGKRPLWNGLPEHEAVGPSSKRPRLSTSQMHSDDALSDVDFEMFMQAGVFA
ncbi:hypothetical protein QBC33DRAFT_548735 [Phialemonium atrogriseum]|uniref:Uncharacterized protein n=1 Tax=Phialemonium atrogriseum TaxID=1093897 RepID=A0AAJ0FK92_9PEZI|nr:uncharacterized protein QBC33DRAFT_548735 [Phialemonium atrogriseum]KAK1763845.1 hypothetical protein QBC33DRAFT_548735 [Phialemonium atrogriseum]